jgi:hypothetical protein
VRAARLLFVLLALLARSAAGATTAISLASRADTIEIEGSAELNADAETAWRGLRFQALADEIERRSAAGPRPIQCQAVAESVGRNLRD